MIHFSSWVIFFFQRKKCLMFVLLIFPVFFSNKNKKNFSNLEQRKHRIHYLFNDTHFKKFLFSGNWCSAQESEILFIIQNKKNVFLFVSTFFLYLTTQNHWNMRFQWILKMFFSSKKNSILGVTSQSLSVQRTWQSLEPVLYVYLKYSFYANFF